MKKATRILGVLTLIFSLLVGLGFSAMEMAEAASDEVTVTLHKKKMTALPAEPIQNTGEAMDFFSSYDDMPNVEFTAYDVSTAFYDLRNGGSSVGDALSAVADTPDGPIIHTGTTGADGKVSFKLDAKSDGKDAIYVFVETAAPSGTPSADNLVLALPMYNDDNELMTDILLYPKNVVEAAGKVTVTKKGTADGEPLQDAQFIVSRELTSGNIEYLAEGTNNTSGLHNWTSVRERARIFTTSTNGQLVIENLERGEYTLIEIVAPNNASIIKEGETVFTIGEGDDATLAFDVLNDTILVDKEHEGNETDYNIGDLIPYSITVNIPQGMGYQFPDDSYRHPTMTITDAPDVGLQFNNDLVLTAGTTTIPVDLLWLDTAGNGFTLTIPAAALAAYEGQDLLLTYHMYLDENADPDVGYKNLATVRTGKLTHNDEGPEVYTGGRKFFKRDQNFETNNALAGAKFIVKRTSDDLYLHVGADNAVTWVAEGEATKLESGTDGIVEVFGLATGDYELIETDAPEDYVLNGTPIPFEIVRGSYGVTPIEVMNIRKGRLPSTGGSGILGIVGIGAALVAITGGYYIKRKREE